MVFGCVFYCVYVICPLIALLCRELSRRPFICNCPIFFVVVFVLALQVDLPQRFVASFLSAFQWGRWLALSLFSFYLFLKAQHTTHTQKKTYSIENDVAIVHTHFFTTMKRNIL